MLPPPIDPAHYPVPPAQVHGETLLVQGEALALVHRALLLMATRNGHRPSTPTFDLLTRRTRQAMDSQLALSRTRQRDTTFDAPAPHSLPTETIGTREAAEILGVSQRSCQRLAFEIGGARCSSRWIFTRAVVEAYHAERIARTED
ncbi:helix-turn-helix domain-containing protein [Rhodococcus sp. 114MFTsu3.1]|uniref:helix-turn-helix domain-containing protein n=1 Tax=Rhodococcus sp. 114MFTsu3.1 TaxID=1172184 RepID=UPI000371B84F|nr:helix-turn-helix domain-containing protein [Rhodococcus sp. 114MFTsu3.1]